MLHMYNIRQQALLGHGDMQLQLDLATTGRSSEIESIVH